MKHVFALLIWVECNEDVKEFNDVKKRRIFFLLTGSVTQI